MDLPKFMERFAYEPETGHFRWRVGARTGQIAGSIDHWGYRILASGRRSLRCKAHRLAWAVVHGDWPVGVIDHINGNRDDNRICNLRDVSASENRQNQLVARADSQTGLMGVSRRGNAYLAVVSLEGKRVRCGPFLTAQAAHEEALQIKRLMHPSFRG